MGIKRWPTDLICKLLIRYISFTLFISKQSRCIPSFSPILLLLTIGMIILIHVFSRQGGTLKQGNQSKKKGCSFSKQSFLSFDIN
jgi:hypothetical protein